MTQRRMDQAAFEGIEPEYEVGGALEGQTTAALTTGLVSFRKPDGLILSTGNLYFTSHDANFGTVWRMAQSAVPGQEILLYSALGAGSATSYLRR